MGKFTLLTTEGRARRGRFETVHGTVETPVFMNVGTSAAVKGGISTDDLKEVNCQVELSNTYHLHVRPGDDLIYKPSEEWALFVLENRKASISGFGHHYDVVIGPVADDGVAFQLERYNRGIITLEMLIKELTYRKLNRQYFFGTERAISKLKRL